MTIQLTLLSGTLRRDAYGPYKWQATTTADPIDDGPCDCVGRGMTPMEALDRCADEAEDAESFAPDFNDDDVQVGGLRRTEAVKALVAELVKKGREPQRCEE